MRGKHRQGLPGEPGFGFDRLIRVAVPSHIDRLRLKVAELGCEPFRQASVAFDSLEPTTVFADKSIAIATLMTATHVRIELILE